MTWFSFFQKIWNFKNRPPHPPTKFRSSNLEGSLVQTARHEFCWGVWGAIVLQKYKFNFLIFSKKTSKVKSRFCDFFPHLMSTPYHVIFDFFRGTHIVILPLKKIISMEDYNACDAKSKNSELTLKYFVVFDMNLLQWYDVNQSTLIS